MPSPFPGMDPFLEAPDVFPDFHSSLALYIRNALQRRLPAPYFATLNERTWLELSERAIQPDVALGRMGPTPARGGVALAEISLPSHAVLIQLAEEEHRETFLEVFTGRGRDRRLVTCVEILSPSNKTRGRPNYQRYRQKQEELQNSDVNLVEIDLLRAGDHTTLVPRWAAENRAGPFDYHVCVTYSKRPQSPVVYPVKLRNPLPEVAFPLLPGDGAVLVDLQKVFTEAYEIGPYAVLADYAGPVPPPALAAADAAWVQERLEQWAARSTQGGG